MRLTLSIVLVSTLTLMLAFQNCSQSPQNAVAEELVGANNLELSSTNLNKINLNQEAIESVLFYFQELKNVEKSGNQFTIKFNKSLTINIQNNQLIEANDLDTETQTFCLTDELKNELVSLLNSSQVCKTQPVLSEGEVCSKVIDNPYAEVITHNHIYQLGYASDSCGHDAIDLCADQSQLLQGFMTHLKSIYTQLNCSN